jgi:bile acid:Na+ symporter, BASS family
VEVIRELFFTLFWAVSLTLTLLFVATRMLYVGLSVAPAELGDLRRNSSLLVRALLANFIIVPALGVAIAAMVWVPTQAALAVLLLAMLGGGVDFLALGEKSNGESRHGPALIFVLSLVGGLMSPIVRLAIQPIGAPMLGSAWVLLGVTLLTVPLPLIVGLLVRRAAPTPARVLSKAMGLVAVLLFIAAAASTFLVKAPLVVEIGVKGALAMVVVIAGAGVAGWLLGGPSGQQRALLARTTMMRNAGLGLLLAIVAFPDSGVDVAVLVFVLIEISFRVVRLLIGWTVVPSMPTLPSRKS